MKIIRKHKTVTKRGTWQIVGVEGETLGNRYWVAVDREGKLGLSRTYPSFIDLLHELDVAVESAFISSGEAVCR